MNELEMHIVKKSLKSIIHSQALSAPLLSLGLEEFE